MKVLVLDDSRLFHNILGEAFAQESDISPVVCHNLTEGIEKLKSELFDFVCVSMHLEDGDGISFTKTVRKISEYKHTPIVLFTSKDSKVVYANALKSGVTEVFQKNNIQQLINFIHRFTSLKKPMRGRILYVEDSLSQRAMVTSIFTKRGLKVDAFATAEEAFESFLNHEYDLVITDIVLEGRMTGVTLTNYIRRLDGDKGDIPILALTGFDDVSRRIELFSLSVSDYVIKPLIEEELLARVRNLIASRQFYVASLQQKRRAEMADKAKSDFLSKMSHDLRTPLNAILGYAELILMNADEYDAEHNDSISEIFNAGRHLLELVNDTLDLAAIESGKIRLKIEDVELDDVLDQCLKLITVQAGQHGIELINKAGSKGLKLRADYTRLKQVLLNLLSNAVKYNRHQGSVIISCKVQDEKYVNIGVTDTGYGISQSDIGKLFSPFERLNVKAETEGTGIGLVICKDLVERMGGEIGVKSEIDNGSTFWVRLPLVKS
ncbi:MAG: response regulator [Gammaproteobacteria bacterium]|nr:response regulator [Gammaproteobacteria bacterium]